MATLQENVKRKLHRREVVNPDKTLIGKYCKNLYTRFEVNPNGGATLCCGSWLPIKVGNILRDSVKDVFNSEKAQELRNQMFTNDWKYCNHDTCPHIVADDLPEQDWIKECPTDSNIATERSTNKKADGSKRYFKGGQPVFQWEKDALENKSLTPYPYPIDVLFGTDESCNLWCPSCRPGRRQYLEGPEYERRKLVTDKLMDAVFEIDPAQKVEIWVTGSGDPFGSKIYRELLQKIDGRAHPNLHVNLQTNGVMLTPKMYDSMHKIHDNLNGIIVSFDAGTKDTYENKTRLGGNWDILLKNCDYLSTKSIVTDYTHVPRKNFHIMLGFSYVVSADNYKEMPVFIDLVKSRWQYPASISFSLILDWDVMPDEAFIKRAVWAPSHPEYNDFMEVLKHPLFKEEGVTYGNMRYLYDKANQ